MKTKIQIVLIFLAGMSVLAGKSAFAAGSISIDSVLSVNESPASVANTQSFQLSLNPSPSQTTTINFSTNGQCVLSHADQPFSSGGAIVSGGDIFDMRVRAVDDDVQEGAHQCYANFTATSSDSGFGTANLDVTVSIIDDGDSTFVPSLSVVPLSGGSLEEGSQNIHRYKIVANNTVADPIEITAYGGPDCEMIVNNARRESHTQTIAVGGQETGEFIIAARQDTEFEGFHSCIINHRTNTIDLQFSGVTVAPYVVSVKDDDNSDLQNQREAERQNKLLEEIAGRGIVDYFDANNDGINDSEQDNVQSFINAVSAQRQAIVTDGCNIDGSVTSDHEQAAGANKGLHFPYGTIAFQLVCDEVGASATVHWYLDQAYPADYPWQLRKVSADGQVEPLATAAFETRSLQNGDVTIVSYRITDGGFGDEDGAVNGVIVDPVGLALPLAAVDGDGIFERADVRLDEQPTVFYSLVGIATIMIGLVVMSRPTPRKWLDNKILGRLKNHPWIDKY